MESTQQIQEKYTTLTSDQSTAMSIAESIVDSEYQGHKMNAECELVEDINDADSSEDEEEQKQRQDENYLPRGSITDKTMDERKLEPAVEIQKQTEF